MAGLGPTSRCKATYKNWNILTITSIYILETILFSITKHPSKQRKLCNNYTNFAENYNNRSTEQTSLKKAFYARFKLYNILPEHINDN